MKAAAPLLTLGVALAAVACSPAAGRADVPGTRTATHQILLTSSSGTSSNAATITVVGQGTVSGTPDQGLMSFGVTVSSGTAAGALAGESSRAQKLIDALKGAGIADADIQTAYLSLYRNDQTGQFTASSSVSAKIHGISHIGPAVDAAVSAAGDSVNFGGISLSIADTSGLMGSARAAAVHDAQTKAQQYAEAAGMKLGGIVSISEADTLPRPIVYGGADMAAGVAQAQPIQAGQQHLEVSVTVVFTIL